jgi:hypothetical protein
VITVKRLREELLKFADDCVCYAYEGEVRGIIISPPGGWGGPGVIHCGEEEAEETRTDVSPEVARASGSAAASPTNENATPLGGASKV